MMNTKPLLLIGLLAFEILFVKPAACQTVQPIRETVPVHVTQAHRWWNLQHYTIAITPDYHAKFVRGTNAITFVALQTDRVMQIDLQEPMSITRVTWRNKSLLFKKEKNAYLITFPKSIPKGKREVIQVAFEGYPQTALNPPFGSGWIWASDKKGRPWMSVACEGAGASIWLPCKEVMYDEPDNGVSFSMTVSDSLLAVANGRLTKKKKHADHTTTYTWQVTAPINNYNIIPTIGKYVTWHKSYAGLNGSLDCDYWVLDYNLEKAQNHLRQTDTMLRCFEYWLGPYPFYEDSYKLVEAPMPGMEHQSAVAYGNGFENGYSGKNLSGTKWGLLWDFILVHESGHEWFGNSITESGGGHSWIHEGFTKYLETLYTEYVFGLTAAREYALGTWKRIKNDQAIIGGNTSDKYYKGSAMLHMIRQISGDTVFRGWLHLLNQRFYHCTANTEQVLSVLNDYTKEDFTKVFDQYLRTTQVPVLDYKLQNGVLSYRWSNCVEGFAMPIRISLGSDTYNFIFPTSDWQELKTDTREATHLMVDTNFYVNSRRLGDEK